VVVVGGAAGAGAVAVGAAGTVGDGVGGGVGAVGDSDPGLTLGGVDGVRKPTNEAKSTICADFEDVKDCFGVVEGDGD